MRIFFITALVLLLALGLVSAAEAQTNTPAPGTPTPESGLTGSETCYTYNLADSDNPLYPSSITVSAGTETDFGILSEDGEIIVSWQEAFNIHPTKVELEFRRVSEIGSNPTVTFGVNAFSFNFSGSTFVPPMEILYAAENPSLFGEGNQFLGVFQTTLPVYLTAVTIYVDDPSPFDINTCNPFELLTPSPTPTPTATNTPNLTPTATPVCVNYLWGGGSVYPTEIDKFTGGSGEGWVSGSWGYGFNATLGTVIDVDIPDGYIKSFGLTNINNTGGPGNYHIDVSGVEFVAAAPSASCSSAGPGRTHCTFNITAGYPSGIYATDISIWGSRGTGEGPNTLTRPYIWLRDINFQVCSAPPATATATPTLTVTPTATRTPVFSSSATSTATGIFGPETWTPVPTNLPTNTALPSSTPPPPTAPPPSSTPLPSSTPRPTDTLIPLPTFNTPDPEASITTTPFPTYQGPVFTPLPDTPDFDDIVTPGQGTLAGTSSPGSTVIPRPDDLSDYHDEVVGSLETAVAQVNGLPRDLNAVLPPLTGLYDYVGQAKWLASGVSLQEIFGLTVYHIPLHIFYGFLAVGFISFIMLIFRVVMWLIRLAMWIIRFILKIIPFIG